MRNLADVSLSLGDHERAIASYQESLQISRQCFKKHHTEIVSSHIALGAYHQRQAQYEEALHNYQMAIVQACRDSVNADWRFNPGLNNILHPRQMLTALTDKAAILAKMAADSTQNESLWSLALGTYQLAANVLDKIRLGYLTDASKLTAVEEFSDLYVRAIDAAMQKYRLQPDSAITAAFYFAEKKRAMVLWETFSKVRAEHVAGIPDSMWRQRKKFGQTLPSSRYLLTKNCTRPIRTAANLRIFAANSFPVIINIRRLCRTWNRLFPNTAPTNMRPRLLM